MEYETDTSKETLDIREHMRFCCDLLDSEAKLQAWNEQYFDENGGVSAGWLLKTVGECELYICYFEYQGLPCIAVPFYILGEVGMAQGIVRFKDSRPLPPETGPLGVFLLASVCRHFVQNPSYELKWLFLSPIRSFALWS